MAHAGGEMRGQPDFCPARRPTGNAPAERQHVHRRQGWFLDEVRCFVQKPTLPSMNVLSFSGGIASWSSSRTEIWLPSHFTASVCHAPGATSTVGPMGSERTPFTTL